MLIPEWKDVLKRAWSVKFLTLAAVLSGCETIMQLGGSAFLPQWVVPAVVGLLSALGILARVLAQHEAEEIAETETNHGANQHD